MPIEVGTKRACSRCGMPIVFLEGKTPEARIPAQAVKRVYTAVGGKATAVQIEGQTYVNHFETCPYSEHFSRDQEEFRSGKKSGH